jgi:7,8-dihydro-6-hydroxymethylpterin-pyrophosphokinase
MILLETDSKYFVVFPFERDTPRTIDVDTVAFRQSMKAVEVKAWNIQFCQRLSLIQSFETAQAASQQILPYATAMALFE